MKKQYNKPAMEAIEMKHQSQILAGSPTNVPIRNGEITDEQYVW